VAEGPFGDDVLAANRRGELGPPQLTRLGHQLDRNHSGILGRLSRGLSPFAKDIKGGRVDIVEGAITKKVDIGISELPTSPRYFIRVANRAVVTHWMRTDKDVFESAPDAGFVRAFVAPHSRWIINLEMLPDPPVGNVSVSDLARGEAVRRKAKHAHDVVGEAEARADLGAMPRKVESFLPVPPAAVEPTHPDALRTEIVGTWESPFMTITFGENGTLAAKLSTGTAIDGSWSIGADGQLRAEMMGGAGSANATVAGDRLTVVLDGQALQLDRVTA